MWRDRTNILALFLIGLIFFSRGFFNYGDIGMAFLMNDMMLLKAKQTGIAFGQVLAALPWSYSYSFTQHTYNYSLSVALVNILSRLVGFSPFNAAYIAIAAYLTTIITAYYVGKHLENKLFGLIFGFLYATDVYFNVNARTGSGIYFLVNLLLLSSFLFFLLAHKVAHKRKRYLAVAAFLSSLCFFNGYPLTFIILPIIVIYVLLVTVRAFLKFDTDIGLDDAAVKPLSIPSYITFFSAVPFLYVLESILWDVYTDARIFTTIKGAWANNFARQAALSVPVAEYIARIKEIIWKLFIDIDRNGVFALGGVHSDTSYQGEPIIPYILLPFFLFGFYKALRERTLNNRLFIALFLMFCYVLLVHFQPWAPRVWVPMTLFVLLITSKGVCEGYRLAESRLNMKNTYLAVFSIIVLLFSHNRVSAFIDDLGENKIFNNGQTEIVKFLSDNAKPGKKTMAIIIGDKSPYDWLHNIYVSRDKDITVQYAACKDEDFLNRLLSDYDDVFVIAPSNAILIGNPGKNFNCETCENYINFMQKAYPEWLPKKVIASATKIPLHYIFDVKEMEQVSSNLFLAEGGEKSFVFRPAQNSTGKHMIKRIHFLGEIGSISLKSKDAGINWEERLNSSSNMSGFITDRTGEITFFPFGRDAQANVSEMEGLKLVSREGVSYYELSNQEGYVIFKFDFPYDIKEAEIMTNPVVFNDIYKKNTYTVSYSTNGKSYKQIAEVKSNGNERYGKQSHPSSGGDAGAPGWPGKNEYATYNFIHPGQKTLFIKLSFYNPAYSFKNSELFHSSNTFFRFHLKNSETPKPLYLAYNDSIEVHKRRDGNSALSFIFEDGVGLKQNRQEENLEGYGFEKWDDKVPVGWNIGANGFYRKSSDGMDGKYSLEIKSGDVCCAEVNRPLAMSDYLGAKLTFSAFVKAGNPNIATIRITTTSDTGVANEIYSDFNRRAGEWEQLAVSDWIPPETSKISIAILNKGEKGSVFVADKVKLTKTSSKSAEVTPLQ